MLFLSAPYAYNLGVRGGLVARIDREGSLTNYTANRIHLYALDQILADRNADPAAVNLAWCQQYFPADAAQDIADHYDDPTSPWQDDTRLLTWEAFYPDLSPVTTTQAQDIGNAAIERIDRHRAQLEIQTTLDTRDGKSDYATLRHGIGLAILDLGGTVPTAYGYSSFQPALTGQLTPDCTIIIRVPSPGLNVATVACEYSTDDGVGWDAWPATCSGADGSTNTETISAAAVPFQQFSEDRNLVRFHARDRNGKAFESGQLRVITRAGPAWSGFQPTFTLDLTPDCSVSVSAPEGIALDAASARYSYSVDAGTTWVTLATDWSERYECDVLPLEAGWYLAEGKLGYESVSNGVLRINDTGTNWGDKVKYGKDWTVDDPAVGATVLARMRCPSGGHYFASNLFVADTLHSESLYLKANGMIGLQLYGTLIPVETQEWHTYRVTIRNNDLNVYLDENPTPIIPANGAFIQPRSVITPRVMIGSGASQYTQDVYYDYVYRTTAGAFPPSAWQPATYTAGTQGGTITAPGIPFNQYSGTLNRIRFSIGDLQGRTWQSPVYNVPISDSAVWADFDRDGDVDQGDFGHLQRCLCGSGVHYGPGCADADADGDRDVDSADLGAFLPCITGANVPVDPNCAE